MRSSITLCQVGQKLTGTAATTNMCAQKALRDTIHTSSAARHAAVQATSPRDGALHTERRQIPIVTTRHASVESANTQPCSAAGLTAA